MDTATLLALMLSLQKPGVSVFSQKVVASDSPPACNNRYMPACASPRYNRYWGAYTRPETWEEGVRRYALIAATIEAVSQQQARSQRFMGTPRELSRGDVTPRRR